jgi:small multidrug resistance pump
MLAGVSSTTAVAWMFLSAAILFEVAGTTCMKLSRGFQHLAPSILMFVFFACAFVCNTLALRKLDMSVTYAVWCGVGAALVAIIGMSYFREPVSLLKLASIAMIILGVIGLAMSTRQAT